MLNYLWAGMIVTGIAYAACTGRIVEVTNAALDSSKEAITLCITMAGVIAFWTGLMEIARRGGLIRALTRSLSPALAFLFRSFRRRIRPGSTSPPILSPMCWGLAGRHACGAAGHGGAGETGGGQKGRQKQRAGEKTGDCRQ